MVSLQSESTPWFHYQRTLPKEGDYIPTYTPTEYPSYEYDMQLIKKTDGDPLVEETILTYLQNEFVFSYLTSDLRYSSADRYTLFLPINCLGMEDNISKISTTGFSFEDRQIRVEGKANRDRLLKQHMVPFRILPEQLKEKEVHILTKEGFFDVNEYGWITSSNQVVKFIEFPHATIFFITEEINP